MDVNDKQMLWDSFLERWPRESLDEMSLEQYISVNDIDTFTYWIETKTRSLGSIKGNTSAKFGIYKRQGEGKQQSGIEHGEIYTWRSRYGNDEESVFAYVKNLIVRIAKAAYEGDLQTIYDFDFSPLVKWKIAFLYQNQDDPKIINTFSGPMLELLTDSPKSASYPGMYNKLIAQKPAQQSLLAYGDACIERYEQLKGELEEESKEKGDASFAIRESRSVGSPTLGSNKILYGPPGTGKTYNTICEAVAIAEPELYQSLRVSETTGPTPEQYIQLKDTFSKLTSNRRVRFVTFHQNYGYEEFVEGLKAEINENDQVEYHVRPGIFKQICDDASTTGKTPSSLLNTNPRIWKLSIDGTGPSKTREYCFKNQLGAIGWGYTGDMSLEEREPEQEAYFEGLGTNAKSSITEFSSRMAKGDIVVCVKGQWSIQAIGVVDGEYEYREGGILDKEDFCHTIPVKWLRTGLDAELYSLNNNTRLTLKTCYELTRFNSSELFKHLARQDVEVSTHNQSAEDTKHNFVLIIDEINRGNISKVFGELITLIEPSKRAGNDESLELILPYSGKPFSVPNNLHIIGTMNTADRSLAMMDTALRRRFDFKEMMPNTKLLSGKYAGDVDLEALLNALNQRIEILYDREHTLGHAFFINIKTFDQLVSVFQNKIIPLLEEYFFEDWDKIRLVLADNQKEAGLQFVSKQEQSNEQLKNLFGNNHQLDRFGEAITKYTLEGESEGVWTNPQAYIGIYKGAKTATDDKQESEAESAGVDS
ncbi:AAA family ATPase [Vibrio breoganii]